jgi:hypothetical protein
MANHDIETGPSASLALARSAETESREAGHTIVAREPVEGVTCRLGDGSCAGAHAAGLQRRVAREPARVGASLLQLQRQYGNQYVQRVLSLFRSPADAGPEAQIEAGIQRARGGGHSLDTGVRRQMESAFGADFSAVKVHRDSAANSLSSSVGARAFTTGSDIFFSEGAYNPGTSGGRELLAHELTHVVQQNGRGVQAKLEVSQPGDESERAAEETAHAVMQRERISRARDDSRDLMRQPETVHDKDKDKDKDEEKHKKGK